MKDYTYITNPETNQKVSLFSNEGSELLNQYISIFKIGEVSGNSLDFRNHFEISVKKLININSKWFNNFSK